MPETTARFAAALIAATFAWAGAAKLIAYRSWTVALAGYRLPGKLERVSRVLVPLGELAVVLLIVVGRSRAGAALTLALIAGFSVALVRGREIHGDRLPCGCFGGRDERSAIAMMWRNGLLALVAVGVITSSGEPRLFAGLRAPDGDEIGAVLLIVVGSVVAAWTAWQVAGSFKRRQVP